MEQQSPRTPFVEQPEADMAVAGRLENRGRSTDTPTLRGCALAAVASCLPRTEPRSEESSAEELFLQHQLEAGGDWPTGLASCLANPADVDKPLVHLSQQLDLSELELLCVSLATAVEHEVMVGRALAHLQAPVGGSRPTMGLLAAAFGRAVASQDRPADVILSGAAVASGLLVVSTDARPLPERTISVPAHLILALGGSDGCLAGATVGLGRTPEVPLPSSILSEAERQALSLRDSSERVLVLRTASPAEGRSVANGVARSLGLRPLFIENDDGSGLAPWLLLRGLLPVFCVELTPGQLHRLPDLPCYTGPVLALCGPDGSVATASGAAQSWSIPVPPRDERRELWRIALRGDELADTLAAHHRHGSGRIAHLGRLALRQRNLEQQTSLCDRHVLAASWTGEGGGLETLAQPLPEPIPDEALVGNENLLGTLRELLLRCRTRDGLTDDLGVSATARYQPGVRALLVGPSGTGKTLAAGWLATQLGLPLFRVDLASVTSKYIGETEKNLSQLLARAEQAEVVLLFDEADSLFGKRTDVQQANDRFANAQTNYLLQRIETYDGITLLTSNSRSRFDPAFMRRLDIIVEFPLPGPSERHALWLSHLGRHHRITGEQLNRLAATADLTGGQIRNVVLAAAVLAQSETRTIGFQDIVRGLISEYRKQGRKMPVELRCAEN